MYYKKPTDVLGVLNGMKVKKPTPLRFTNYSYSESSVGFSDLDADIRYKLNGTGDYTQWDGSPITLQPGEYVEMVGDNQTAISTVVNHFVIDGQLSASGSVMALVSSTKITETIPQVAFFFAYLFYDCTGLTSAPELPATVLAEYCYHSMFSGCTGLTSAPELPATALAEYCYQSMFSRCTGLTSAPELPATVLADYCYRHMFRGCTSLTSAPELPATVLKESCYGSMFRNCTSLASASKLHAMSLTDSCCSEMFSGCTSLASAPELPAMSLTDSCYNNMFKNCTSLASIEVQFDEWVEDTTDSWLDGVAASGTFTCPASLEKIFDDSHIPAGWTVVTK